MQTQFFLPKVKGLIACSLNYPNMRIIEREFHPSRDRGKTQLAFFRHARRSYRKRTVSDHCRDGKGIQSKSVRIPQVPAGEQAEQGNDGRPVSKPCSLERDRTGTLQEQNRVKRLHPETVSYGFGIKNGGYPETRRLHTNGESIENRIEKAVEEITKSTLYEVKHKPSSISSCWWQECKN